MKVLVPFDFTEGVRALRHAVESYADVDDVHVYAVHFSATPHESVNNIVRKEVRDLIDEEEGSDTITPDQLTVEVRQVDDETPEHIVPAIEQYATERAVDQIIMSKHDRSLLERVFGSSNTEQIRDSAVAPVTII